MKAAEHRVLVGVVCEYLIRRLERVIGGPKAGRLALLFLHQFNALYLFLALLYFNPAHENSKTFQLLVVEFV